MTSAASSSSSEKNPRGEVQTSTSTSSGSSSEEVMPRVAARSAASRASSLALACVAASIKSEDFMREAVSAAAAAAAAASCASGSIPMDPRQSRGMVSPLPTVRRNTSSISRGVTYPYHAPKHERGASSSSGTEDAFFFLPETRKDAAARSKHQHVPRVLVPPHVRAPAHLHSASKRTVRGDRRAERVDQRGTAHAAPRVARRVRAHKHVRAGGDARGLCVVAVDDDALDERGDFIFVPHALGSEPVPPHLRKQKHVPGGVARDAARRAGRLGEIELHASHGVCPRFELVDAPLVRPRRVEQRVVHDDRGRRRLVAVTGRWLELLARPLHGVAVHEKRVAVVLLHRPDERLGPHLVSAVANPEVGHGIGVHRRGDARGSTAGATARVAARGGGDEAVRDAEHAHRRRLGRGKQCLRPRATLERTSAANDDKPFLKIQACFASPAFTARR
mmetsp:Transcript_8729/g.36574  ORF Transcript_8729/g.36574 Transcript_8729/m.36574 type:complete len:449 (-) Transcript_8729:40-1386(-)